MINSRFINLFRMKLYLCKRKIDITNSLETHERFAHERRDEFGAEHYKSSWTYPIIGKRFCYLRHNVRWCRSFLERIYDPILSLALAQSQQVFSIRINKYREILKIGWALLSKNGVHIVRFNAFPIERNPE